MRSGLGLPGCEWGRAKRAGTTQNRHTRGKRHSNTTRKCGVIGLEQGKGGPTSVEKAVVLALLVLPSLLTTLAAYRDKRQVQSKNNNKIRGRKEQATGRGMQPDMQSKCSKMQWDAADKQRSTPSTDESQSTHRRAATPAEELRLSFNPLLSTPAVLFVAACDLFPPHRDSSRFASSAEASGGQERRTVNSKNRQEWGGLCSSAVALYGVEQAWPQNHKSREPQKEPHQLLPLCHLAALALSLCQSLTRYCSQSCFSAVLQHGIGEEGAPYAVSP